MNLGPIPAQQISKPLVKNVSMVQGYLALDANSQSQILPHNHNLRFLSLENVGLGLITLGIGRPPSALGLGHSLGVPPQIGYKGGKFVWDGWCPTNAIYLLTGEATGISLTTGTLGASEDVEIMLQNLQPGWTFA